MKIRTAPILASVWSRLALLIAMFNATAAGQISPGALSRSHHDLDGIAHCSACHDFGLGSRKFKCLECHSEIQKRIMAGTGLHARGYHTSADETDCARCHLEHNGGRIALVRFDTAKFDHKAETGFSLEGAHAQLPCAECHRAPKIASPRRAEIKVKDLNHSFLGLGRECASCHKDPHAGEFGSTCTNCHVQNSWRPASGFSHAKTKFPLTGLHSNVGCEKCHSADRGQPPVHFAGVAFGSCRSCHNDPHRAAFQDAKFGAGCDSCHTTSGWKTNRPGARFNHESTSFPLQGKHADLACSKCHRDADFRRPIPHARCADCHDDPHKGQFAARAAGSDCGSCHNESAFRPSRFTRETHQSAAFRLDGKHASLPCDKCHPAEAGGVQFKVGRTECAQCHQDPHRGQFETASYKNQCELCHTAATFQPAQFDVSRHAGTRFPLTGAHAKAACNDCHKADSGVRHFRFSALNCSTCHNDPHQTKVACETCHSSTAQWKTVAAFDHSTTSFQLQGAHRNKECARCHAPKDSVPLKFAGGPRQCSSCHADPHAGQFSAEPSKDCSACHTMERWSATDFSHDRTRFPLDVAHRNIACERCHKNQLESAGKTVRIFRGAPVECVRCH